MICNLGDPMSLGHPVVEAKERYRGRESQREKKRGKGRGGWMERDRKKERMKKREVV